MNATEIGPGGTEGGPLKPTLPRQALYYYAAFIARTTEGLRYAYIMHKITNLEMQKATHQCRFVNELLRVL